MHQLGTLSRALWEAYPATALPLAEAVTHLGSVTVLMLALALLYWVAERRTGALLVSFGFVAYATVLILKAAFGLPRPPESLHLVAIEGSGFPSGHAAAAVIIYGGLVLELDWLDTPRRIAPFALAIPAIALSRVALRVHYLGSVLAGLALGLVLLVGLRRVTGGDPTRGFGIGLATGALALVVVGVTPTVLGIVGACLGGVVGTQRLSAVPLPRSRLETGMLVVAGILFIGVIEVVEGRFVGLFAGVDDLLLVSGILLMPAVVSRASTPALERLGRA